MSNPLVSVIIPTYNGSKFLLKTICSVLNQNYHPLEIIIIDDGSSEDIPSVIKPLLSKLIYIKQNNAGPAAARNHGLQVCKGEYIAFLDHDDIFSKDKISKQMNRMFSDAKCGMVYSFHRLIDGNDELLINREPNINPSGYVLLNFAAKNYITTFSATLIKREIFDNIGYLNESAEFMTADDYDIYLRIAEKYKILYSSGRPLYYRIHDGNLVKSHFQNYSATTAALNALLGRAKLYYDNSSYNHLQSIVKINMLRHLERYAFLLYRAQNKDKAKILFRRAFLSKPWIFKYLLYFLLCNTSENFINIFRQLRYITTKYDHTKFA